jgi:hypothetical protein
LPLHEVPDNPAEPLPQLTPIDERHLRNTAMENSIFYVAVCIAIMYLGVLVGHAATLPDNYRYPMLVAAFSGFLATSVIALYTWRRGVPLFLAHPLATLIVAITIANSAMQLGFSGDMKQSSNFALITVAVGCFFLSRSWGSSALSGLG